MTITTANAATTRTIVALDLGKYKSVACIYQRDTAEYSFHSRHTAPLAGSGPAPSSRLGRGRRPLLAGLAVRQRPGGGLLLQP